MYNHRDIASESDTSKKHGIFRGFCLQCPVGLWYTHGQFGADGPGPRAAKWNGPRGCRKHPAGRARDLLWRSQTWLP